MGYELNQFNQSKKENISADDAICTTYMTLIKDGKAIRLRNNIDSGISGGTSLNPYYDEGVIFGQNLTQQKNYYLHTKIKRLDSEQVFSIYLCKADETGHTIDIETPIQFLKTITIQPGALNEWVDFEIILTPILGSYNCIVFRLERNIDIVTSTVRHPYIAYEEFSNINSIFNKLGEGTKDLLKIGVQSHPGLMMCINGEEIHIGRTGIYELRSGEIVVNFFSVVAAALEKPMLGPNKDLSLEQYLEQVAAEEVITEVNKTNSKCIFSNDKIRNIDAFTLDYMYKN